MNKSDIKETLDNDSESEGEFNGKRAVVLLSSGWAVRNIGDIGHTPGALRNFETWWPEAKIYCWVKKYNDKVKKMLERRFPETTFIFGGSLDKDGNADSEALRKGFEKSDWVIQNSGMPYNRFWKPSVSLIDLCLKKGKRFGIYGQSFDGLRENDKKWLPKIFSNLDFIFCRDCESLRFMRELGIDSGLLEFGPDGCFGIDVRDDYSALKFMASNGLRSRKFLVAIFRSDLYSDLEKGDPLENVPGGADAWGAKMRQVIINWIRTTGLPVALVPEVEKEIEAGKQHIIDPLPSEIRKHVIWKGEFWNADEAVSLYANARIVLSMEPHSCIMALASGTPAVHYFSSHHGYKAWMFRDIGLPEWLISLDFETVSRCASALKSIHGNYEFALQKANRAMRFVQERSKEMIQEIRHLDSQSAKSGNKKHSA